MGAPHLTPRRVSALLAIGVIALDQVTKSWMVARDGPIRLIGDFLQLRVSRNAGAAFSSFTGGGRFIAVIAVVVIATLAIFIGRSERTVEIVTMGAILGGATGNLLDRIFRGSGVFDGRVVDWIDFSFFPSFNVADSALTIGIGVLILVAMLRPEP
ncbi:MAG: signal peptidase II [Acidimicrobiia bacterium]